MKTILSISAYKHICKSYKKAYVIFFITFSGFSFISNAQCPSGYTSATINWDNLDYLHSFGWYGTTNPTTGLPFVTTAMKQTQYFAIGTNRLTISTTINVPNAGALSGDVTAHTGETGAYGTGADIAYLKTGTSAVTITLTFLNEVRNLQFSVFDIDQEITFAPTATNAASVAQSITLTKPAGVASAIPLNGNAAATTVTGLAPLANWATGGGSGTNYAYTSNLGTINVDIAGPVKTVVLTFSNDGNANDFFLSDITACVADPGFPTSYYSAYTQPFTGQGSYFLANPQNLHVYMVDPTTGVADYIFSDPGTGGNKMNALAYDPVNHLLYYVMDNAASPPGNLTLKKYDFSTETISTVISNLATFGIPCFIQGVEFAGASFYNGSLYIGIEGTDGTSYTTNAESIIWRIDFDGSGNATTFAEAFGTPGDDGVGNPSHDWGDLVTKDGIIISHATGATVTSNHYIHYNLQTGASTNYAGNAETGGQLGQTWNGNVYRIKNAVALYNNDGTIGSATSITTTSCSSAWSGNAGDASDPFKPKCDFGDAPASYDPVALSPAVNQKACNNATLRLGTAWDREWSKNTSANASGDGSDEDGITTVTILNSNGVPYNHVQQVTYTNNTGANATLGGWLDYNADGVFTASEGRIVTVPSTGSGTQTANLSWLGLTVPPGTPNTFLRIRLVSGSLSMTTSSFTGWYVDGEVEDYYVISNNLPLSINLLDFNAYVTSDKTVELIWTAINNDDADGFQIQRSTDQTNWVAIGWQAAGLSNRIINYNHTDLNPVTGKTYYRLKLIEKTGNSSFSIIKSVYPDPVKNDIRIVPNSVRNNASIFFTGNGNSTATLSISNLSGQVFSSRMITVKDGENHYPVDVSSFPQGVYIIAISTPEKTYTGKMLVY